MDANAITGMELPEARFEIEDMTKEEQTAIDAIKKWRLAPRGSTSLREFQAVERAADKLLESEKRWNQVAGTWNVIRDRLTGYRITVQVHAGSESEKRKAVREVLEALNQQVAEPLET